MRKWIPPGIVVVSVIASLALYSRLPDQMPTHWGFDGRVNGWSSRAGGAFVMPFVLLCLAAGVRWLPRIDPRRANYEKFRGTFDAIFLSVMLFVLGTHFILLAAALGEPIAVDRWIPVGVGLLLIVLGNLLPRARPNWFIGVRTPWTLSSDLVWTKTHRVAGYVLIVAGIATAIAGITGSAIANVWVGGLVVVAVLGLVAYSYVVWRAEPHPSAPAPRT